MVTICLKYYKAFSFHWDEKKNKIWLNSYL